MVHALKEAWRVLAFEGSLIDLRPLAGQSRIEVMIDKRVLSAGLLDESSDKLDDIAADEALAHLVDEGSFIQQHVAFFDYALYWDTPDEMKAYAEARWKKSYLPDDVLTKVRQLMASSAIAKVRIRRRMMIARYQKLA